MQGGVDSAEWRRGSALRGACRQLTRICLAQLHAVTEPLGLVSRPCGKAMRKHVLRTWGRTCLRFYPCVTCTWCCGAACFACPVPAAVPAAASIALLPAAGMLSKPGRCASGRTVRHWAAPLAWHWTDAWRRVALEQCVGHYCQAVCAPDRTRLLPPRRRYDSDMPTALGVSDIFADVPGHGM